MRPLAGRLVALRPLAPADGPRLRAIRQEPGIAEWWGPLEADFPDEEPESTRFAIVLGEEVVGMVQYGEEPEPDYRYAWIDVFVATAHQGQGVGTDAVRTLLRHLIDDRGHHRVTIDPSTQNAAAIRCYEKAGFAAVGVMHAASRDYATGGWRDDLLMERVELP
jgi:aminoglycoside 6'-N-acetyltransferase